MVFVLFSAVFFLSIYGLFLSTDRKLPGTFPLSLEPQYLISHCRSAILSFCSFISYHHLKSNQNLLDSLNTMTAISLGLLLFCIIAASVSMESRNVSTELTSSQITTVNNGSTKILTAVWNTKSMNTIGWVSESDSCKTIIFTQVDYILSQNQKLI